MRRILLIIIAVLLMAGCSTQKKIPYNAMYNSEINVMLQLGMDISAVDKLLGEPTEIKEATDPNDDGIVYVFYNYEDIGMSISMSDDGKVTGMHVGYGGGNWQSINNVAMGTSLENALNAFNTKSINERFIIAYYDSKGNQVLGEDQAAVNISIYAGDDGITAISVVSVNA